MWYEELKRQREEHEISQRALALGVGISREYLNKIENGKRIPSENLKQRLQKTLQLKDINGYICILLDYVKVRFRTRDFECVMEKILQIPFDRFYHDGYGSNGYQRLYRCFDIVVMVSDDPMKGTIIEMKGQGCRTFEGMLEAQNRSWYDFLGECMCFEDTAFKRLDIAIDDKIGFLNVRSLIEKCENGECSTRFNTYETRRKGEGLRDVSEGGIVKGDTLYLGSKTSDVRICIYEKDVEQYMKLGVPIEEASVQNRVEVRLKNDHAWNAVADLLGNYDVEETVFSIINRYVCFLDAQEGVDRYDWEPNPQWMWFVGDGRGKLRLTTKPEPHTLQRTINWYNNQVSSMAKVLMEIDAKNGTNVMGEMLDRAKLTDKHKKIIEQATAPLEDMILPSA